MLSEAFNGLTTIRAFASEPLFLERNKALLDANMQSVFAGYICNRWLSVRIETIGNCVLLAATLLAVLSRGTVAVGLAGVSITSALMLVGSLNWLVRLRTNLETQMVATERVLDYSAVEQDAPRYAHALQVPRGHVEFRDFCLSYRRGLPLVLDRVSFCVEAGQRVGIVGRTGAGKSSLLLALFRFVEASAGQILLDGTDIAGCGTDSLRQAITIIPQEPTLFSSTLRFNLDPTGAASDAQLWEVLAQVRLADKARALEDQLAHVCSDGSFSAGEKQLVCFARALVRPSRVVVMDEVTANVDAQTDQIVQQLIVEAFRDRTVLLIAHRLQSVWSCDKILVLAHGRVAQFGAPDELMADKRGEFFAMAREA
jgi:ABC-type multidrug transport system fused ATPase/permease subunit